MKKLTTQELTNWYGEQDFDNVTRITGVDIWGAVESDEIKEGDTETISRDEALAEARGIWDAMSYARKLEAYNELN